MESGFGLYILYLCIGHPLTNNYDNMWWTFLSLLEIFALYLVEGTFCQPSQACCCRPVYFIPFHPTWSLWQPASRYKGRPNSAILKNNKLVNSTTTALCNKRNEFELVNCKYMFKILTKSSLLECPHLSLWAPLPASLPVHFV